MSDGARFSDGREVNVVLSLSRSIPFLITLHEFYIVLQRVLSKIAVSMAAFGIV